LSVKDEASATKLGREMSGELRALVRDSQLGEELTALLDTLDRSDRTEAKSTSSSRRTDSESRRSTRDKSRDDK